MKDLKRKFICTLTAFALCTAEIYITVPSVAYADTEKIIDLDLSDLSIGDTVPNSIGLGNGNTNKFRITEVDESVSKTKRAVEYISSAGDKNNNAEIYFNIPEINTTNVSEPTDYYIDVKLMHYPTGNNIESGMTVKYVFYNSENTSKTSERLFFMGLGSSSVNGEMVVRANAGAKGGYAKGYAEPNEWYRLIYDIHIEPDASKDCVNLKMYKVGEEEPEEWQTTLSSGDFNTNGTNFNNTKNIDLIGFKAYNSLMKFADLSIYKYTDEDLNLYNSVKENIRNVSEKIQTGEMTYDEVIEISALVQSELEQLEGITRNLAEEEWNPVYSDIELSRENIQKVQDILQTLEASQITKDSYEELYSMLESARELTQSIIFYDKSQEFSNTLDEQEALFLDFAMNQFSANEHFDYTDGYMLENTVADTDNGWTSGWTIENGISQIKDGALNVSGSFGASRTLLNPIVYSIGRKYYLGWNMKAESGAGMDLDGIKVGVAEKDGKLYPQINDNQGTQELLKGNEYKFILVADTDNSQYGMYIYGEGIQPKKTYDIVCPMEDMSDIDKLTIYNTNGSAEFDDIILQMYNALYGQDAFEKTFEAYNAPYSTDEETESKSMLAKSAEELVNKLNTGILKTYLSFVCSITERNVTDTIAERLFAALDKKLTVENFNRAQAVINEFTDETIKKEYQIKLDTYYTKINSSVPVIESIGIQGVLKSGNVVSAVIKSIDETGNGAKPIIEWYVGGRKVGETNSLYIKSEWAGSKIYCEATPVNNVGTKGTPVTSTKGTIASANSGGGGGGSGGSRGSGVVSLGNAGIAVGGVSFVENTPSPVYEQDYKMEKFDDVREHWAKDEIYKAFEKGIVVGVSDNSFEPERPITRAEFVKMLFEVLKMSESQENNLYKDVQRDAWYAPYINAVSEAGIVEGSDGFFRPADTISRQETAKIMASAYQLKNNVDIGTEKIDYADMEEISLWAKESVNICAELGLMQGVEDNVFSPLTGTTRAQAVVIIMRLADLLGY